LVTLARPDLPSELARHSARQPAVLPLASAQTLVSPCFFASSRLFPPIPGKPLDLPSEPARYKFAREYGLAVPQLKYLQAYFHIGYALQKA